MNKLIKIIFVLALTLAMMMSMTITVLADSNVTYQGESKELIFSPGSDYSPTDLFVDFKGVMPGDSLNQTIEIRNENSGKDKVKIYLKALGAHEGSDEFLSQMTLAVDVIGGDKELFDAPANETAQLTDWVLLGTLENNAAVTLSVTLNVPITMENDFQNAIGYLDWQFKAEHIEYQAPTVDPTDIQDSNNDTKTGDEFNIGIFLVVAFIAIIVGTLVLLGRRKVKP